MGAFRTAWFSAAIGFLALNSQAQVGHECVANCGAPSYGPPAAVPSGPSAEQLEQQRVRALNEANENGIAAFRQGRWAGSVRWFQRALEFSPYTPALRANLAKAQEKLREEQVKAQTLLSPSHIKPNSGLAAEQLRSSALHGSQAASSSDERAAESSRLIIDTSRGVRAGGLDITPPAVSSDPIVPQNLSPATREAIRGFEVSRQEAKNRQADLRRKREALQAAASTSETRVELSKLKQTEQFEQDKINFYNFKITEEIRKPVRQ